MIQTSCSWLEGTLWDSAPSSPPLRSCGHRHVLCSIRRAPTDLVKESRSLNNVQRLFFMNRCWKLSILLTDGHVIFLLQFATVANSTHRFPWGGPSCAGGCFSVPHGAGFGLPVFHWGYFPSLWLNQIGLWFSFYHIILSRFWIAGLCKSHKNETSFFKPLLSDDYPFVEGLIKLAMKLSRSGTFTG